MKIVKKLYFAYGSNMNQKRLEARVGKVTKVGVITLPHWKLEFNCGPHDKRFANITMTATSPEQYVEGVVYELTSKQMKILDHFEGYPFFYQKIAFPKADGKTVYAYACFNPNYRPLPKIKSDLEYMQHLLIGCTENKLVKTLRRLEYLRGQGVVQF
jgi:hypothetical protein